MTSYVAPKHEIYCMKILHTADWHLGKRLDNFSRLEEQIKVMNEIVQIAEQENVDLVLIAGDLFDAFNPSVEAVELFYKTLKRLSNNGKRPVVAIAGNHDSPNLIDAPNPLARECGIILIGHPNALISPFQLADFSISKTDEGFLELSLHHLPYPIRILHTPYANEQRLKQFLGEEKEAQLNQTLAENWQRLANTYCDNEGVNLLITHLYMNPSAQQLLDEPDGEKPLKIGNADLVLTSSIPQEIHYTALGHLHKYQNIGSEEKPIVYSSSPLCYSFSEAGQTKYVNLVEIEPNEKIKMKKIELKEGKPLIRKHFDSVDKTVEWLQENQNALVELTLESDTYLQASDRQKIYRTHKGIIHLIPQVKNLQVEQSTHSTINLNKDISELFRDYFQSKQNAQQPTDEIMELFNEILHS